VEAVRVQRLATIRAHRLATIAALKEAIQAEEVSRNDELLQIQQQEQELHRIRSQQLPSAIDRLSQLSEQLSEQVAQLQQKRVELVKIRFLHEARQVKLLSELQSIYPIDPGHHDALLSSSSSHNNNFSNNNIAANSNNSTNVSNSTGSTATDVTGVKHQCSRRDIIFIVKCVVSVGSYCPVDRRLESLGHPGHRNGVGRKGPGHQRTRQQRGMLPTSK
jgi:hypothetical protein